MILIDYFMHLYLKWTHKRIDYNLYLKTSHWKRVSHKAIKRANYHCQLCGTYKGVFNVHHNRYYDNKGNSILFHEKPSDLICVCNRCHKTIHHYIWNNIKKAG
ncbi:hypothetical protein [Clostridium beijerinckii]|uniref:hypothetical protein n=1 Tax=Clostridium beijerinckii TaxID=1520 RepID=UPI001361BB95|nr:hypothetical protein [Clostridium beijerinckii]MZK53315.1 hypothetical protein [Clostridium beijerinckii]MZK61420.1 hypothetical protein [Clostridium beijerinckii]MZK71662.1 hypothetical protein [Clostridium beijerinckii]MZK77055.1 hypothetical protein [Clostridium beijerinckii]MZK86710.1 hypothetical protein [Clostridium beijerinckii]